MNYSKYNLFSTNFRNDVMALTNIQISCQHTLSSTKYPTISHKTPSPSPTLHPTATPSHSPSHHPTNIPTDIPSSSPTNPPSLYPAHSPSNRPSVSPTKSNQAYIPLYLQLNHQRKQQ